MNLHRVIMLTAAHFVAATALSVAGPLLPAPVAFWSVVAVACLGIGLALVLLVGAARRQPAGMVAQPVPVRRRTR